MCRSIALVSVLFLLADCIRPAAGTPLPEIRHPKEDLPARTRGVPVEGAEFPDHFAQVVRDRGIIDTYQKEKRTFAPGIIPQPMRAISARHRPGQFIRTVRASPGETALSHRARNASSVLPLRGFQAPILDAPHHPAQARLADDLGADERETAALIEERLAGDGLLLTLAKSVTRLGTDRCLADPDAALLKLSSLGLPVDLLRHFRLDGIANVSCLPRDIVKLVAQRLRDGAGLETLREELGSARFEFAPTRFKPGLKAETASRLVTTDLRQAGLEVELLTPKFEAVSESGENSLGMFRLQAGGGWRDGIVPGGSLDMISQLAQAHREADFLISVIDELAAPFESMITNSWPLRRRNQVTLAVESSPVGAWAQDNGKAGVLRVSGAPPRPATLAPRYASIGEGKSLFAPGESYLMDGLSAAGHAVIHSPLLFQGGNMLVARFPKTGERVLVLGEGEVCRNVALGLNRAQAIEAFRREFGVDRCVVLPALSYHLDFDVCLRADGDGLIAFVNDHQAAVRVILGLGLAALERHGALDAASAAALREHLANGREREFLRGLKATLDRQTPANGEYPAALSRQFVADSTDDAVGNLQTFLLAVDLVEAGLAPDNEPPAVDSARAAYLDALRRMSRAQARQIEQLRRSGCRIVPVPSMADLHRGINYLNGIHHQGGYIMPVFGGFHASLDREAQAVFRRTLGEGLKITVIRSSESQRMHGGIHCAAAAYPGLPVDP